MYWSNERRFRTNHWEDREVGEEIHKENWRGWSRPWKHIEGHTCQLLCVGGHTSGRWWENTSDSERNESSGFDRRRWEIGGKLSGWFHRFFFVALSIRTGGQHIICMFCCVHFFLLFGILRTLECLGLGFSISVTAACCSELRSVPSESKLGERWRGDQWLVRRQRPVRRCKEAIPDKRLDNVSNGRAVGSTGRFRRETSTQQHTNAKIVLTTPSERKMAGERPRTRHNTLRFISIHKPICETYHKLHRPHKLPVENLLQKQSSTKTQQQPETHTPTSSECASIHPLAHTATIKNPLYYASNFIMANPTLTHQQPNHLWLSCLVLLELQTRPWLCEHQKLNYQINN